MRNENTSHASSAPLFPAEYQPARNRYDACGQAVDGEGRAVSAEAGPVDDGQAEGNRRLPSRHVE